LHRTIYCSPKIGFSLFVFEITATNAVLNAVPLTENEEYILRLEYELYEETVIQEDMEIYLDIKQGYYEEIQGGASELRISGGIKFEIELNQDIIEPKY
jgi:hypothetical protein